MFPNQVSYRILNPISTHFRPATCEDVDCEHYLSGWQSLIDESTDLGQRQAHYIRKESARRYTESRNGAGLTVFTFEAGQSCFGASKHRTNVGLNPLFAVDRLNDSGRVSRRVHSSAGSWGDDLHTHTDDLLGEIGKG